MTNTQNIIDDVSGYIHDAYNDQEPADFLDLAEELRKKLAEYQEKAQSDITANVEAMQQERHEKQVTADYRRALL
jgi:hypothetical protein